MYIAHTREDGKEQSLKNHLTETAKLAKAFASSFHAGELAYQMGLAHDLGKYSKEFQDRIKGISAAQVDHSTSGGIELNKIFKNIIPVYGVLGHHSGLPNGGSKEVGLNNPDSTLYGRLNKKNLPVSSAYKNEINLSNAPWPNFKPSQDIGFTMAFFIRMLYSALVDADYLDTESFMSQGEVQRSGFDSIDVLKERFDRFIQHTPREKSPINMKRNEILEDCLSASGKEKGLFFLTVPTGGGKTISSLGFALHHAKKHHLKRIVYVIPFTSIIDQNAKVIASIVNESEGINNVIEHHSNILYPNEENKKDYKYLAAENWDAPIIVTTNVQFFESLFAHRSAKCRKLHNLAESVIIFDEAQMLPIPFLKPCIRAMEELIRNYNTTAVLCTATQPSLGPIFSKDITPTEICKDPKALYSFFRRATLKNIGKISEEDLIQNLKEKKQVLCIVNTRKHAQELYGKLDKAFHLSTLLFPAHRKKVLEEIKECLKNGKACRVISTSLIEAGVDLDFPFVYREKAGLDSVIQAAGRCNREGKHSPNESITYIFQSEDYKIPAPMAIASQGFNDAAKKHGDLGSPEAIQLYFDSIYTIQGQKLDQKNIINRLNEGWKEAGSIPFRDISEDFLMIENHTYTIFIPFGEEAADLLKRLQFGERSRSLLRKINQYSVNIYENHLNLLLNNGMVEYLDQKNSKDVRDGLFILTDPTAYDDKLGLKLAPDTGNGIFL